MTSSGWEQEEHRREGKQGGGEEMKVGAGEVSEHRILVF